MIRQVMLSYSRKDEAFVHDFHEKLVANNVQTWADWQDIPAGFSWRQAIYDGVMESDAMLPFLSANYLASEMCRMECFLARVHQKHILPIVINDAFAEVMESILSNNYTEISGLEFLTWLPYGEVKNDTLSLLDNEERFQQLVKVINQGFTPIPDKAVHISYPNSQRSFANKLAQDLQEANIPVWLDAMLEVGTNWVDFLWMSLRQASAIVPILSVEMPERTWLKREILVARTRHLPTFPILVQEVAQDSDKVKTLQQAFDKYYETRLLSELQWLKPVPDYETMLQKLVTALKQALNIE